MKRRRWTTLEQAAFLRGLGVLLEKGYSISQSLTLLELQYRSDTQIPVKAIKTSLQQGLTLTEVLGRYRLPADVLGYLYFATENGSLAIGLMEGGDMLRKREQLKKAFLKQLRYPIVLLGILSLMLFFLLQFLFPQFSALFNSVDLPLPLLTQVMMTLLSYFPTIFYIIVVLHLFLFIFLYFRFRHRSSHEILTYLVRFPFLKGGIQTFLTHYFAFQFGQLLSGGLSIGLALQLFEEQGYLSFFQVEASALNASLRNGEPLSETLFNRSFYLPELSQIVQFGQSNGKLGEELVLYSEMLFERTEGKLEKYLALIQPIMFGFIALIVLTLFLSVMLPVFHLFQSV
ncbi:competence type IV pilus assembly protein ComGB [Pseudalkalibacillus berkeleyi]|uniref:Type II secretion system F family protein n=1 Tax=Pseudalkalibacillus berkeleyi TaxID=1069813 RepID=A0ABS9H271_9BACL|nr:competence type IV pilus assembly protein ComGB [Pseudalkalibacillus berkeleyi]MCF6137888.1 type II secretion system F family protein [Pseudalkalibacillus berkeleyi]